MWTTDGSRLIYRRYRPHPERHSRVRARGRQRTAGHPDGRRVASITHVSVSRTASSVIGVRSPDRRRTGNAIWVLPLDGTAHPEPFLDTRVTRGYLEFSPDGHWVAYQSNESGRNEIYVVPYPGRRQVAGVLPREEPSRDGIATGVSCSSEVAPRWWQWMSRPGPRSARESRTCCSRKRRALTTWRLTAGGS